MSQPTYKGNEVTITINSTSISCLGSFTLEESVDLLLSVGPDGSWREKRGGLQGFNIQLAGFDQNAWAFLRGLKGTKVTFLMQTADQAINETGEALIVALGRTITPNEDPIFSATLKGYNSAIGLNDLDYLLQEDGDYLLQEDGSKILL